jgi:flagella basal body P-ring formation protein FlgA
MKTMILAAIVLPMLFLPVFVDCVNSASDISSPINEIRVLKNVTVNQKQVSLLEICDPATLPGSWKKIMSGLDIGEAPAVGAEKFIDPGRLRTYLDSLLDSNGVSPSDVKFDIPDKIIVVRQSTQISQEWVEEIFRKFILENSPWNQQDISVQRVHFSGGPLIPTGKLTYDIRPYYSKERFVGNVTAIVDLYVDEEKVRSLDVVGKVEVYANVYHASRPLKQNEMLSAADLEVHKVNITEFVDRFATHPDQAENRRVLRNIGMHQPLELKDLDKPLVLKRGDPVNIVYEQPGLSVTAKGQANGDAGVGDTLAVVNVSSNKTIYCKVLDSKTVRAVR